MENNIHSDLGIQIKSSNRVETLVQFLLRDMSKAPVIEGVDPVFTPIYIVVQTEGMKIWLRQMIAVNKGIAANINIIKPSDLIYRIYQNLKWLAGEKKTDNVMPLERQSLVWLIYDILGTKEFQFKFPEQAAYFKDASLRADLKRVFLAQEVADLFDQYQLYRTEMVANWDREIVEKKVNHEWQSYIWMQLKQKLVSQENAMIVLDKTKVQQQIMEACKAEGAKEKLQSIFPSIYLFEMSVLTKYHVSILNKIAEIGVPVHFYLLNPAPEFYWLDNDSDKMLARKRVNNKGHYEGEEYELPGNNLLLDWGKVLRESLALIFKENDAAINLQESWVDDIQTDSLLHKIQYQIVTNSYWNKYRLEDEMTPEPAEQIQLSDLKDNSIQVNACFTIAREVETLYHYLVGLVDKENGDLAARDIVVMVSDIDKYAPYINAVFSHSHYRFKYRIADISVESGDSLFSSLMQLLDLSETNFTSETVMQLLESSLVQKKFQITDITRLRQLVNDANIRTGIRGSKKDDTYLISWQYGLQRMMYGLCMSESPWMSSSELYPLDEVEGNASLNVIAFVDYVKTLISFVERRHHKRNVQEWTDYLLEMTNALIYLPGEEEDEDFQLFTDKLNALGQIKDVVNEPVSFEVYSASIKNFIQEEKKSTNYLSEGLTFCSLIPMRSIPFKVVALLGLNDKDFPRKDNEVSFNIINEKHEIGDRNKKDNDRLLFLETLMSAREYLYISYLGFSLKDKKEKNASVLVEELLDYIDARWMGEGTEQWNSCRAILVRKHPLYSFSPKYNVAIENQPYILDRFRNKETDIVPTILKDKPIKMVENEYDKVVVAHKFIQFFSDSIKSFLVEKGIYLKLDSSLLAESELDSIDKYKKQDLLLALSKISEKNSSEEENQLYFTGQLPLKNVGALTLEELRQDPVLQSLRAFWKSQQIAEWQSVSIDLQLRDVSLVGSIDNVAHRCFYAVDGEVDKLSKKMDFYLKVLILRACKLIDKAFLIAMNDPLDALPINLSALTQYEAQKRLSGLLEIYQNGLQGFVPFSAVLYDVRDRTTIDEFDKLIQLVRKTYGYHNGETSRRMYLQKAYELELIDEDSYQRFMSIYDYLIPEVEAFFESSKA